MVLVEMVVKVLNIFKYQKFYIEFMDHPVIYNMRRHVIQPGNAEKVQQILREDFGVTSAQVHSTTPLGIFYLDEKELCWFLLRWS